MYLPQTRAEKGCPLATNPDLHIILITCIKLDEILLGDLAGMFVRYCWDVC